MGFHVGQTFGDYTITALIGAGGMGRLYKVEHRLTRRTEAMKVLTSELASEIQIKRFEREMQVLAKLDHPNIAVLHNAVHSEQQQLILLMEFIEGQTLESLLSAGHLPLHDAVDYVSQILFALRHAHQHGVVHRDVTPANVLVTADGEVKLTDFGLSKSFSDPLLTNGNEVLGSLPYMAPEQVKGLTQPDVRSDLYSTGAILYEALTGQPPFGKDRPVSRLLDGMETEPKPPSGFNQSLAPWDTVLSTALARNPEFRYQSADEFLDALTQVVKTPVERARVPKKVRVAMIPIALIAGGAIALVGSVALNQYGRAEVPPAPAQRIHIAPPDFAIRVTPPAKPQPARIVPALAAVTHAQAPAAEEEFAEPAPPSVAAPAHPVDPVLTESAHAEVSQDPPKKKGFWSKLNVFKKKKRTDSDDKP